MMHAEGALGRIGLARVLLRDAKGHGSSNCVSIYTDYNFTLLIRTVCLL